MHSFLYPHNNPKACIKINILQIKTLEPSCRQTVNGQAGIQTQAFLIPNLVLSLEALAGFCGLYSVGKGCAKDLHLPGQEMGKKEAGGEGCNKEKEGSGQRNPLGRKLEEAPYPKQTHLAVVYKLC